MSREKPALTSTGIKGCSGLAQAFLLCLVGAISNLVRTLKAGQLVQRE